MYTEPLYSSSLSMGAPPLRVGKRVVIVRHLVSPFLFHAWVYCKCYAKVLTNRINKLQALTVTKSGISPSY